MRKAEVKVGLRVTGNKQGILTTPHYGSTQAVRCPINDSWGKSKTSCFAKLGCQRLPLNCLNSGEINSTGSTGEKEGYVGAIGAPWEISNHVFSFQLY